MSEHIKIVICGAKGYVGQELAKLVIAHPLLALVGVVARVSQQALHQELLLLAQHQIPVISMAELNQLGAVDVVLLATPPEVSMDIVAQLAGQALTIIDPWLKLPPQIFQQY